MRIFAVVCGVLLTCGLATGQEDTYIVPAYTAGFAGVQTYFSEVIVTNAGPTAAVVRVDKVFAERPLECSFAVVVVPPRAARLLQPSPQCRNAIAALLIHSSEPVNVASEIRQLWIELPADKNIHNRQSVAVARSWADKNRPYWIPAFSFHDGDDARVNLFVVNPTSQQLTVNYSLRRSFAPDGAIEGSVAVAPESLRILRLSQARSAVVCGFAPCNVHHDIFLSADGSFSAGISSTDHWGDGSFHPVELVP